MTGPAPKGLVEPRVANLVIEPDEDFSFVLEALEDLIASKGYSERMLGLTAKSAVVRIKDRLATLRADLLEAQKQRDALAAEVEKLESVLKRARGQLDAGLASLHGEKLTVNLEVAPPTAK